MKIKFTLLASALMLAGVSSVASAQCYDCECSAAGIWGAWDPEATGHFGNGQTEPGINVRRCGAYNLGATSGVCDPGDVFNIYTSPAPAITGPRCDLVITTEPTEPTEPTDPGDGVDRYQQLIDLFGASDAVAPAVGDIGAYLTGRCYDHNQKSVPLGGLLMTRSYQSGNNGPLFPSTTHTKLFLLQHTSSASAFDTITSEEMSTINDLIDELGPLVSNATLVDNAQGSFYYSETGPAMRWGVRRVNRQGIDLFIALASFAQSHGQYPEGHVLMSCYHYAPSNLPN